jgi:hypothetical protein
MGGGLFERPPPGMSMVLRGGKERSASGRHRGRGGHRRRDKGIHHVWEERGEERGGVWRVQCRREKAFWDPCNARTRPEVPMWSRARVSNSSKGQVWGPGGGGGESV